MALLKRKHRQPPDRVFILSTGRCGSMTFAYACRHLTNYSAAHESLTAQHGAARFAYPDRHIESDNRLSWMLGDVAARFDPERTLYVHLTRDAEEVAQSYLKRWDLRSGIIRPFSQSIVLRVQDWPEAERVELARFYVQVVTANITEFLSHQPRTHAMTLENIQSDFPRFLDLIGAEGDFDAAMKEWSTAHHASEA